ncbi:DNA-binding protein, partial [Lophium mytilinum]
YEPILEDYPVFPPPSPRRILDNPEQYWSAVSARKFAAPQGIFEDSSLYTLYRLYECFVLDKRFAYRNMLEWLWRQEQWKICDIVDPQDDDPARYAFLAGVTCLIVKSFNARVALGLTRGASPLLSMEEAEKAKDIPHEQRPYEKVPEWAQKVPALATTLVIPTEEGETLTYKDDDRADPDFSKMNILLWTPHIYFT